MATAYWHPRYWLGGVAAASPLAAPTLAMTDQADGTGATATISGSTAGTTNTVYTQAFDGDLGTTAWSSGGNRIGDGTLDVALGVGHYLAYVESSDGSQTKASNVVYFAVTDTAQAVHYQCLTAVQSRIQALTLSGVANASIVTRKLPHPRVFRESDGIALPCVLIVQQRETMNPAAGLNSRDDVGYGVLVVVVAADNQEPTLAANLDSHLLWRQKIARAFRNQKLPGVAEVYTCRVEPGDPLIPQAWAANLYASALLLRFISREVRGLS